MISAHQGLPVDAVDDTELEVTVDELVRAALKPGESKLDLELLVRQALVGQPIKTQGDVTRRLGDAAVRILEIARTWSQLCCETRDEAHLQAR